jgi:parvulin-like peptidyl-prolyl isomerase
MRNLVLLSVFVAGFVAVFVPATHAQTPAAPPASAPAVPAATTPAAPVTPPAIITPDTVVGEVDGKKYTAGQVDELLKIFPPQFQKQVRADLSRALSFALTMRYLAAEAEKNKLQDQSPLKETLEYQRLNALSQAEVNQIRNVDIVVLLAEEEKYYKEHPELYQEAKVKVIYVAFSAVTPKNLAPDAKKPLTELEARAKIEDLRKQIVAGADFGKLAKENSDDKDSAAKDGDFGMVKKSSPYPEPIKKAVFELKAGQVSDPIKQPNGFYLVRLEETHVLPYAQVQPQINEELKRKSFDEYMKNLQKRFEVKVENTTFFATKPQAPPPLPAAR